VILPPFELPHKADPDYVAIYQHLLISYLSKEKGIIVSSHKFLHFDIVLELNNWWKQSVLNTKILIATEPLSDACSSMLNTRKYDERCFPVPHVLRPVLITGLGGAGTHNVASLLQAAGILVEHEGVGPDGSVVRG
jgi:hypothetical protein